MYVCSCRLWGIFVSWYSCSNQWDDGVTGMLCNNICAYEAWRSSGRSDVSLLSHLCCSLMLMRGGKWRKHDAVSLLFVFSSRHYINLLSSPFLREKGFISRLYAHLSLREEKENGEESLSLEEGRISGWEMFWKASASHYVLFLNIYMKGK